MEPESNFPDRVAAELDRARAKHRGPISPHEGYAVILEELEEFWDDVKHDRLVGGDGRTTAIDELVQVAAMCQRVAEDVFADSLTWMTRTEDPTPNS